MGSHNNQLEAMSENTRKSRYEVYYGKKPNMQNICLLLIGCVILVTRVPDSTK